jgi:hypothetical protein
MEGKSQKVHQESPIYLLAAKILFSLLVFNDRLKR